MSAKSRFSLVKRFVTNILGLLHFFSQRVDTLWMLCVLAASFSVIYFWPTSADLLLTFLVPPISFWLTNQMIYSRTK